MVTFVVKGTRNFCKVNMLGIVASIAERFGTKRRCCVFIYAVGSTGGQRCKVIAFGMFTSVVKGAGNIGEVIVLVCSLLLLKVPATFAK